jgi:hypothetical protein
MRHKFSTRDSGAMREHCIERAPFKTHGALWADKVSDYNAFMGVGRLPLEYQTSYLNAEYAVYSYNTPIAWFGADGWSFPPVKYSVTTSRHQGRLWFIREWIDKEEEEDQ